ncbi:MAG: CBS domain-containing protein [Thermoplasmata archaeon]|nr:MAG: CBS domain-containing protein [Thermoplasmata archaeon]
MEKMKVRDVMTEDVIWVDKSTSLEHILYLMEKNDITKIPVLDDEKLIGVVTDGEIVEKLGSIRKRDVNPAHLHATSVMVREFDTVTPDTPVKEILKTVGLPGLTMLPVVENDKLVGVVTKADLLPMVKDERPVKEIMTKNVLSVAPDDRVIHARRLIIENNIARLPVVEEGEVLGIIAEMDIARAFANLKRSIPYRHQKHHLEEMLVRDSMKTPAIVGDPEMSIKDAAKKMANENVGCLPIVKDDRIEGIVTRTDVIKTIG